MKLEKMQKDVFDWQNAIGAERNIPFASNFDWGLVEKQMDTLREEVQEIEGAKNDGELIDAYFDTMWCGFNILYALGEDVDRTINILYALGEDVDRTNIEFSPPDYYLKLLDAAIKRKYHDLTKILVSQMIDSCIYHLNKVATNYRPVWKHGSQSNWDKFCKTEEEAELTINKYKEIGIKSGAIQITLQDDCSMFVVRCIDQWQRDANGKDYYPTKVLKSINWKEPDFGQFAKKGQQ